MEHKKFEIEHDIPMPVKRVALGVPLYDMSVGDSILIGEDPFVVKRIAEAAARLKRTKGLVFTVRKQPDGNHRIWRIQ